MASQIFDCKAEYHQSVFEDKKIDELQAELQKQLGADLEMSSDRDKSILAQNRTF